MTSVSFDSPARQRYAARRAGERARERAARKPVAIPATDPRVGRSVLTPDAVESALRESQRHAVRVAPRAAAPESAMPLAARGDGAPFLMPTRSQGGSAAFAPAAYVATPLAHDYAAPVIVGPSSGPSAPPVALPATPEDVAALRYGVPRDRYVVPASRPALPALDYCPGWIGPTLPHGICPVCSGRHAPME